MMSGVRARGEDVRRFIIDHVEAHARDIGRVTAEKFQISRQAVNKHLTRLVEEGALSESGNTRNRVYALAPLTKWTNHYDITSQLAEDVVWTRHIRPILGNLPDNVLNIWHHGFTEMFNNAIDHSEGKRITVSIERTAADTMMIVLDDGVGIFNKIQSALGLLDPRHAVLELAKGKLTTDPRRHSGEGIFFTSRMFDRFSIQSAGVAYSHERADDNEWIQEYEDLAASGTAVFMRLNNHTARTTKKVFDEYANADTFQFDKTVVPVQLARYGDDQLISRSQAKRLLARIELFRRVIFDFTGVSTIGQAFADEIFRVFVNAHPGITIHTIHTSSEVKRMIGRVKAGAQ